ncbi:hypothetical protein H0W91_03665 [Patescibacteria group bacterium]|nr:hypothetical protein [Patescibacteria group bacterium]
MTIYKNNDYITEKCSIQTGGLVEVTIASHDLGKSLRRSKKTKELHSIIGEGIVQMIIFGINKHRMPGRRIEVTMKTDKLNSVKYAIRINGIDDQGNVVIEASPCLFVEDL